jgi:hypothetical protein
MRKTIYDELYSEDDLYATSGFNRRNGSDFIYITKITNELKFNQTNNLQQKVEIRHIFKDIEKNNLWNEEIIIAWFNVPKD